jgi:uncharacterized protein YjiK
MAFDPKTNRLYVWCKKCKGDSKAKVATGYALIQSIDGQLKVDRSFAIPIEAIRSLDNTMAKSFKASAMAKHPTRDEWYIISSIDKALLVTDADFEVKKVVRFERRTFEQPEGMTFDDQLHLYISSEAGSKAEGRIYKIKMLQNSND